MTELTETNEVNNNYDETKCPLCKQIYDEDVRTPRILLNCGHTICSSCISNSLNISSILKCPEDQTEYPNISSLSSFPINKALIKLLHKISDNKKIKNNFNTNNLNLNLNLSNNFQKVSPESSPRKGLNTARETRQNFDMLKLNPLSSSKKCTMCNEHPKRKLEMICLEEICKICTNCAIFGTHKNHNVINIDEFIKDIECKAAKLIEIFENVNEGSIKKELDIINEKSKDKMSNLLELINEKYNYMGGIIHEFTQNLIEKVKKDENLLLNEISSQFDKLKRRIKYYLELPNKINNNIKEWKIKVQDKMNLLNDVKDISDECLKFVDSYGENSFNKLIKGGNNIISDVEKISSFPTDEIQEDIKNLNLTIEKQILNQEFFHINKKLDFGDLCEKYEIPKKSEEKENSNKNNSKKIENDLKEVTNFEAKENIDINLINNNKSNDNKNGNNNPQNVNNLICQGGNDNVLKKLNNITQDTDNLLGNHICDKNEEKFNSFLQKEMEIENIQFGDDSFLFTDLDSVTLEFDLKHKDTHKNAKSELTLKNKKAIKELNPLNLNTKQINKNLDFHNTLKMHKSLDNFNLNSQRNNNITYDRDSIDVDIKKTPTIKKRGIKKLKKNNDPNKSPSINKSKSKSKSKSKRNKKLSHDISKDGKPIRTLSPFNMDKSPSNSIIKNDKINLSRKELGDDAILSLAKQIKKNKERIKEIKLIKCGINDDRAVHLLKAMENCSKLTIVNLANNSLSDKIVNNVTSLLSKNLSISSCYFTNNNFSISSKEKIKSYNQNGKIKIFV